MEPCCHPCPAPVLLSTFSSLPKDKDGWSSPLQCDASFSSHPPNSLIPLIIHMTEEQLSEFWQQLLHSRLYPWMGSVISRRGAGACLARGDGKLESAGMPHPCWDVPLAGQYHTGCLTMEVSLAVLHSAQHQENSRGDFFPTLEGTHGHIPRVDVQRSCLRGTHGSCECPGEGHGK